MCVDIYKHTCTYNIIYIIYNIYNTKEKLYLYLYLSIYIWLHISLHQKLKISFLDALFLYIFSLAHSYAKYK